MLFLPMKGIVSEKIVLRRNTSHTDLGITSSLMKGSSHSQQLMAPGSCGTGSVRFVWKPSHPVADCWEPGMNAGASQATTAMSHLPRRPPCDLEGFCFLLSFQPQCSCGWTSGGHQLANVTLSYLLTVGPCMFFGFFPLSIINVDQQIQCLQLMKGFLGSFVSVETSTKFSFRTKVRNVS